MNVPTRAPRGLRHGRAMAAKRCFFYQSEKRMPTSKGILRMYFSLSQLFSLSAVSFSSTLSCLATAVWTVPPASRWFP